MRVEPRRFRIFIILAMITSFLGCESPVDQTVQVDEPNAANGRVTETNLSEVPDPCSSCALEPTVFQRANSGADSDEDEENGHEHGHPEWVRTSRGTPRRITCW